MDKAARQFFSSRQFAVVGASQDPSKFGYKVLKWYATHNLPVIPINPTRKSISVQSNITINTQPNLSSISNPTSTGVSFITPPPVTREVLREAKQIGINAVWFQPGSFGKGEMDYAKKEFDYVVGGFEAGTVGGEGWCVLVDGDGILEEIDRGHDNDEGDGKGKL